MRKEVSLFLIIVLLSGMALAQVPAYLNFQGQLMQKEVWSGNEYFLWPMRSANVDMTFRLYTSESGGGAVWFENYSVTTSYEGIYNVELGRQTPLTLEPRNYWLGITINTNDEMSPRLPLGSVLSALTVHGLDLTPRPAAPYLCAPEHAGKLALTSNYALCICNGDSWRFVGYGTACQW